MINEVVLKEEEECVECGAIIPEGSRAFKDDGDTFCFGCVAEELGNE